MHNHHGICDHSLAHEISRQTRTCAAGQPRCISTSPGESLRTSGTDGIIFKDLRHLHTFTLGLSTGSELAIQVSTELIYGILIMCTFGVVIQRVWSCCCA